MSNDGEHQRRRCGNRSHQSPPLSLGDDLLRGAGAIAEFLFGDRRQRRKVYYLTSEATARMPHFRFGAIICARKSTLLRWIEDHERGVSDA